MGSITREVLGFFAHPPPHLRLVVRHVLPHPLPPHSHLILDSANATSSFKLLSRWWQTMSMSKCSSIVLRVPGMVGFVELGMTLGLPQTVMISGA